MRFLTNENIPGRLIRSLRVLGYEVLSVRESMRGASDEVVLARAQEGRCVLVTQDKDFGELAFRSGLPSHCGIILFRLGMMEPEEAALHMLAVLMSQQDWTGFLSVVTDKHLRRRPLK